MQKARLIAVAGFVWFGLPELAIGQTVVPLNTGFHHGPNSVYSLGVQDDFWINIASSLPTTPAPDRAWTVPNVGPWLPALPGSTWISRGSPPTSHVDTTTGTGYSIFRKCFCMMSFSQAKISFQGRGDNATRIWLNTVANQLAASASNYNGPTFQGSTNDQSKFKIGVNCLYVLVEDDGGSIGFDLTGTISAFGLMPMPASGTAASFKPCDCNFAPGPAGQPGTPSGRAAAEFDDSAVVRDIVKIAQSRAATKGTPPTQKSR
jgi:hypothetical protein